MGVKCFLIEPSGKMCRSLRRYSKDWGSCPAMPGENGYHNASVPFDEVEDPSPYDGYNIRATDAPPHDDPRWPTQCTCGYQFTEEDEWQFSAERLYRRTDTGEEMTTREAKPGAIYDATWYKGHKCWTGPDGKALIAILPNGQPWHIDGPANNCTDPEGALQGNHKCWVRHGEAPTLTVDKNGPTCNAGAGSILSGNYHGFLRNGEFTD